MTMVRDDLSECANSIAVDVPDGDAAVRGCGDDNKSLIALTDLECVDHVLVRLELGTQR